MITVPTRELIGLLSDVIPFAGTDPDDVDTNRIRLEWDGEHLIALATDRYRLVRCTWNPDDEGYTQADEDQGVLYGPETGARRFSVRFDLEDAKSIVKAFKLRGVRRQGAPVALSTTIASVADNTYTLRLFRAGTASWSPLAVDVTGFGAPREGEDPEVNLHELIDKYSTYEALLDQVRWTPKLLAAFAKVRTFGPLEMRFTGEESPAYLRMGSRFTGLIIPVRAEKTAEPAAA